MASELEPGEAPGLWRSRVTAPVEVGYPDEAHQWCLSVEESSFWFRHRNACILAIMAQLSPPGPLLDVGAGNGFVSLALQQAGIDTIVLEPGADGARRALARGLQPVICSSFEDAGFRAGALSAVGLFDVLEHFDDDVGFLRRLHHAMAPGALLYVTVPSYRFLWSTNDVLSGHHRRYTLRGLSDAFSRAGFDSVRGTYFMSLLPLPILLARVVPSRLGLRKRVAEARTRGHHVPSSRIAGRVVAGLLGLEAKLLVRGGRVPFGASCLAVARRQSP